MDGWNVSLYRWTTNKWMDGMKVYTDGQTNRWMDGMEVYTDGQTDRCME